MYQSLLTQELKLFRCLVNMLKRASLNAFFLFSERLLVCPALVIDTVRSNHNSFRQAGVSVPKTQPVRRSTDRNVSANQFLQVFNLIFSIEKDQVQFKNVLEDYSFSLLFSVRFPQLAGVRLHFCVYCACLKLNVFVVIANCCCSEYLYDAYSDRENIPLNR